MLHDFLPVPVRPLLGYNGATLKRYTKNTPKLTACIDTQIGCSPAEGPPPPPWGPGPPAEGPGGEGAARTALGHRRRRSLRGARGGRGGEGRGGRGEENISKNTACIDA